MENNAKIFMSVVGLLILGVIVTAIVRGGGGEVSSEPGKYDTFATCLAEKGAVFYGAFWCSHCQAQKKLFGSSAKLLPYVECSTADARSQTQICIEKGVSSYPTWVFADDSRLNGEVALTVLAEKTGCSLPE